MPSHYETLGVAPTASLTEVKAAYRAMALKWHPDKNRSRPAHEQAICEERFKEAAQAYEILSDATERTAYDRKMLAQANSSASSNRRPPRTRPRPQTPPRIPSPIRPQNPQPPAPRPLGRVRAFARRVGTLFTHKPKPLSHKPTPLLQQPQPFWHQQYGDWCYDILVCPRFKVLRNDSMHSKSSLSIQQRLKRIATPSLKPGNFCLCIKLKDIPTVIDVVEVQCNEVDDDIDVRIHMYGSNPEPDPTNEFRDWYFVFDLFEYYDQLFRAYSTLMKPYSRTRNTGEKATEWVARIITGEVKYSGEAIAPLPYSGTPNMFDGQEDGSTVRSWDLEARIKNH